MSWNGSGGWVGVGLIPQLQARAAEARAALGTWTHAHTFSLVVGQRDYIFPPGGDALSDAASALVQWGVTVLPPEDYEILPDRIRLAEAPSIADAALGQPLIVRVSRAA